MKAYLDFFKFFYLAILYLSICAKCVYTIDPNLCHVNASSLFVFLYVLYYY